MWVLIFTGGGLCYADFKGMDLAEYQEAVQARILYNEDWASSGASDPALYFFAEGGGANGDNGSLPLAWTLAWMTR
ncbi:MAG: hypothetical protein ACLVKN_20790 [Flavonifractor plautii]